MWSDDSTALRSGDWYDFRDPGQVWERNYYQTGTGYEQLIEGAVRTARRERVFDDFTPEWVDFLRTQPPGAGLHRARDLARARERGARLPVGHDHALRRARGGDEAAPGPGLPALRHGPRGALRRLPGRAAQARASSRTHPGSRRAATSSACVLDAGLGRAVVATNLCFEPIVGLLIRRELLMRSVSSTATSSPRRVSHVAQLEWEWARGWTAEFVRFVLRGRRARRRQPRGPRRLAGRVAAAGARGGRGRSRPVFDELPAGIAFEDARVNVQIDVDELFEDCGLAEPGAAGGHELTARRPTTTSGS